MNKVLGQRIPVCEIVGTTFIQLAQNIELSSQFHFIVGSTQIPTRLVNPEIFIKMPNLKTLL